MGIHCDIKLFKPPDSTYVPGEIVSGIIKYVVTKDTPLTKIIVSLKGNAYLKVTDRRRKRKNRRFAFKNCEEYVDIDRVLREDLGSFVLSSGRYETNFNFRIPTDVPPSFTYEGSYSTYYIRCYITYYVRIKFKRPGVFKRDKYFRKKISVLSGVRRRLPITPAIFSEQKKLFKPFANKTHLVDIKAVVEKCVIQPGGRIELNYEVFNDTNITIKSVKTKLEEIHTFKPLAHSKVKVAKDVPFTETKTAPIKGGETQNMLIEMNVPSNATSIENSSIVSKEYFVKITVGLPKPHFDAVMEIPVQIGNDYNVVPAYSEAPPTYWEAMGELDYIDD